MEMTPVQDWTPVSTLDITINTRASGIYHVSMTTHRQEGTLHKQSNDRHIDCVRTRLTIDPVSTKTSLYESNVAMSNSRFEFDIFEFQHRFLKISSDLDINV